MTKITHIFTHDNPKDYFNRQHKESVDQFTEQRIDQLQPSTYIHPNFINSPFAISKIEIEREIKNLKNDKAPGQDNLANNIIKLINPSLINFSTSNGKKDATPLFGKSHVSRTKQIYYGPQQPSFDITN